MFRPDCARAYSRLEDRGDCREREGQGEEVLVQLAGLPPHAVAVPVSVQPERNHGCLEDLRAGTFAHTWPIAYEPQHVLER